MAISDTCFSNARPMDHFSFSSEPEVALKRAQERLAIFCRIVHKLGIAWPGFGVRNGFKHEKYIYNIYIYIYMGAVRKSRSQIYELMRLLCLARLLKPASR